MDSQPTQACWCRLIYGILVKDVTKLNTWLQQTQREEKVEDENDESATKRPADETADDIDAEINVRTRQKRYLVQIKDLSRTKD